VGQQKNKKKGGKKKNGTTSSWVKDQTSKKGKGLKNAKKRKEVLEPRGQKKGAREKKALVCRQGGGFGGEKGHQEGSRQGEGLDTGGCDRGKKKIQVEKGTKVKKESSRGKKNGRGSRGKKRERPNVGPKKSLPRIKGRPGGQKIKKKKKKRSRKRRDWEFFKDQAEGSQGWEPFGRGGENGNSGDVTCGGKERKGVENGGHAVKKNNEKDKTRGEGTRKKKRRGCE